MKGSTVMTTTNELHPIWTDSSVMEALHGMHSVLGEWEQVGAAEEANLDSMEDVQERFTTSLGMFFEAMQTVQRRNRKRS